MLMFNIKWHDAEKELPDHTCNVCIIYFNGYRWYMCTTTYSQKYRAFNAIDQDNGDQYAYEYGEVRYWTYQDYFDKCMNLVQGGRTSNDDQQMDIV